ncbi:hypothetical protein V7654_02620 [Bacillus sp. JJ1609]|uniref:hypothetical protein n=1 Tax=Bacillus sp. JJ1609 TaxID=3122977 RepID=UPI0030006675
METRSGFVVPELSENVKHRNVALMVILSNITFGIYIPYWLLKQRSFFESLDVKNEVPFRAIKIVLWLYVFFFFGTIIGPIIYTDMGLQIKNSIDYIVTFYGLGIIMYTVFRIREMLNDHLNEDFIKPVPLLFFHIWYLQYKLNRMKQVA